MTVVMAGIASLISLTCSVTEIDTHLGTAVSLPRAISVTSNGDGIAVRGMGMLTGTDRMKIKPDRDSGFRFTGARFSDHVRGDAWVILEPQDSAGSYKMEWQMVGEFARDGTHSIAEWARGTCRSVIRDQGARS